MSLPCSSSPHRTRFAGLRWGPRYERLSLLAAGETVPWSCKIWWMGWLKLHRLAWHSQGSLRRWAAFDGTCPMIRGRLWEPPLQNSASASCFIYRRPAHGPYDGGFAGRSGTGPYKIALVRCSPFTVHVSFVSGAPFSIYRPYFVRFRCAMLHFPPVFR